VRVQGQTTLNSIAPILQAAIEGHGIAYLTAPQVQPHIANGTLVAVLEDWTPPFAGYHLYYPSRRQPTAAFKAVLDALRYRERP
jgi:DNA-binding transcriptional LysR family regulator